MHACMHARICICKHVCMCLCRSIYISKCIYKYICACVCENIFAHLNIYIYMCVFWKIDGSICKYIYIPVVPHKAVAEVSKIGNL